jgi:H+-transporting ATPase
MNGLTTEEAQLRLQQYGPNTLREESVNRFLLFLQKFWAPVPWMLEIIILLEFILEKFVQAGIIAILIVFNAVVSFLEEGKARSALGLLRKRLDVQARVMRDGAWKMLPAEEIVPDDLILLQIGDIVPADVKLLEGYLAIDQSAITGESLPVETSSGGIAYAGSAIKRGQAYAQVIATGTKTFYGKSAEIMRTAKTPSHLQTTIFSIVKYLVAFDVILIIAISIISFYQGIPLLDIIPFSLLLLVASVPAALPATYALSTALGAIELASRGVFVTRLSAIEEAAAMTVLSADKTGTITENSLEVSHVRSFAPYNDDDLLTLASFACEEATQDPLDLAILSAAAGRQSKYAQAKRKQFLPFDPAKKHVEALIEFQGRQVRVLKGATTALLEGIDLADEIENLSSDGSRLLAVTYGEQNRQELVGLIALRDPPRKTSKNAIEEIDNLGIRIMMMTGDELATAQAIAKQVGIGDHAIRRETISSEEIEKCDVISGVFPEDKFKIIQLLQKKGHICGMTGDGVNDAPALKKAEVGIAVSNATDVAKAAASLVLTNPGLGDILEAVKTSRRIYQRMLTYTLNKIIKTLQIAVLLGIGLVITRDFIISQLLIVLLLIANDFVTMSIATDHVSYSPKPDKWDIKKLMLIGGLFAFFILGFSFFILYACLSFLHLPIDEVKTAIFLLLVFSGQATVYLIRERKHFWHSMPSRWMLASSVLDITIVSLLAIYGILMAPINVYLVLGLLAAVTIYFFLLDFIKVRFRAW